MVARDVKNNKFSETNPSTVIPNIWVYKNGFLMNPPPTRASISHNKMGHGNLVGIAIGVSIVVITVIAFLLHRKRSDVEFIRRHNDLEVGEMESTGSTREEYLIF
ncbi:hypothetical protein HHK36_020067 [Tetracentron sinense]|uniref:Uncharacterized protein n=1 Tax=Tetracentron sinense TaxID=13715 RepID=A0A834YR08_TETSI|nr:hypothetical protein HHK36_020067 [Tetracentron sinense]